MAEKIKGITLEIGGNCSGLNKAISSVNKETKATQKELSQVERLLKFDPKNTELLAQKQHLLGEQMGKTKEKLEALKNAKKQADDDMKNGTEVNEKQYRLLQREIVQTEQDLKKLTKETSKFTKSAENLKKVGNTITDIGKKGMIASGAIVGLGAASVAAFNEVDDGADIVIKKTGAVGDKASEFEQVYKDVAKTIPASFEDIGSAVGEINTRMGFTDKQLQKSSEQFLKFARINDVDVNTAVQLVSRAMGDAGINSKQYGHVLDLLSTTAQSTGISIESLTTNLAKYGAPMRALGLDTKESIAIFGTWEKAGVNTEIAFSGMKKAISNWGKEGKDGKVEFAKTLEEIKKCPTIAAATSKAIEVFGAKAGPDLADAIKGGRFEVTELLKTLDTAGGSTENTYNALIDGSDKAALAAQNAKLAMSDMGSLIMQALTPIFEDLADKLQKLSAWFGGLSEGQQKTILVIAAIAAAIPPLLIVIGTLINSISVITGAVARLNLAFLASPITWLVVGIVGLVAAFVVLWNKCEGFRNFWISCWNGIKTAFFAVVNFIKENWKQLALFLVNPIAGAIALLYKLNPKFKAWVDNLINSIKAWFGKIRDIGKFLIEGLWNGINDKVEWLKNKVSGVVDKIKGWFTGKKGFDEHSPSKWSEKVGAFLMQGLANGITDDMSAEDALQKKISNLKSFISDELGLTDKDISLADAEYSLWELQNPNATDTEKSERQLGMLMTKLQAQSDAVDVANTAYEKSVELTGANSAESKEYQLQLVNERIELEKLEKEMEKVINARKMMYSDPFNGAGAKFTSSLKSKLTMNPVHYMRQKSPTANKGNVNVTQNYYGYKGTVSENNTALKKTIKNMEVSLA